MTDTPALYFNCRAATAAGSELSFGDSGFRTPVLSPKELKALRSKAIRDGAIYVKGRQGMTVFSFGVNMPEVKRGPECEYCGNDLNVTRSGKKFCSDKCRVYASRRSKRNNYEDLE